MRTCLISLGMCLCGGMAAAGAWPREAGSGFAALSYEMTTPQATVEALAGGQQMTVQPEIYGFTALYAEYGLTDRLTLGVDTGQQEGPDTWSGVVFLRLPLDRGGGNNRFAAQLGLGQRFYEQQGIYYGLESTEREWIARPLLAWGRGFDSRWGHGWMAAEASAEWRQVTGGTPVKLDLTLGLERSARRTLMVQVQTGDYPDSPAYARILPGVVQKMGAHLALESALILSVAGDDSVGFRAGIWMEF